MAIPPNIEIFDQYAAKTFALLYENFPLPRSVGIGEIDAEACIDDVVGANSAAVLVQATIRWLKISGYITYTRDQSVAFFDCCLTLKGFEVLKAIPESLSTEKNLGEELMESCKAGAMETAKDMIKIVFTKGFQYIPLLASNL